ncbi:MULTISPECIES: hypothetical protein [Flavobacterium]|nr:MULTISPECIES: hypothetical protein [Flavobacterium]UUF12515.1 hypothetical protein NLJ00_14765 [Flavobacterium panici]
MKDRNMDYKKKLPKSNRLWKLYFFAGEDNDLEIYCIGNFITMHTTNQD